MSEQALDHAAPARPHPLEPVRISVLGAARGAEVVSFGDDPGATWYTAELLTDPDSFALTAMLDAARARWKVPPHAAAALAFKGYAWAATLPVVAGWAVHQRVPILETARLRIGLADRLPYVRLDLSSLLVATLRTDPAAAEPGVVVAHRSATLLSYARGSLVAEHLAEVIEALHHATRVGHRLLWGTVAESVVTAASLLPSEHRPATARGLLHSFGAPLADLVELTDDRAGAQMRRRTCCLWFLAPESGGTYCSTCCVTPPPDARS